MEPSFPPNSQPPIESAYGAPPTLAAGAVNWSAPDLRVHPPRSPRTRLGGFAHLPRMIDKARAFASGRAGDYRYPCPFDQRLLTFTGIEADAFLAAVKRGLSDSELLAFVLANAKPPRTPAEIVAWSAALEQLPPAEESRAFFDQVHRQNAPHRADIVTWFDWLELDDLVTFGGRP